MAYTEIEKEFFIIQQVKPMKINDTQLVQLLLLAINKCYFSNDKSESYTKTQLKDDIMDEINFHYLCWSDILEEDKTNTKVQKKLKQLKERIAKIWSLKQNLQEKK